MGRLISRKVVKVWKLGRSNTIGAFIFFPKQAFEDTVGRFHEMTCFAPDTELDIDMLKDSYLVRISCVWPLYITTNVVCISLYSLFYLLISIPLRLIMFLARLIVLSKKT